MTSLPGRLHLRKAIVNNSSYTCSARLLRSRSVSTSKPTVILALESSADDSCAAIVDSTKKIHANVVLKQQDLLLKWGGIHPLHATTAHSENMPKAVRQCLDAAKIQVSDVDAIAYTRGPGMPSCLAVAALAAKTLAAVYQKPLIGVHHMQAHALTVGLTEETPPAYPYLTLLLSGGHTLLLRADGPFKYDILATTGDDSIGDAFDKVARWLDLPMRNATSGGQALEDFARDVQLKGDEHPNLRVPNPGHLSFSYSGLKSAVRRELETIDKSSLDQKRVLAASFQSIAFTQLEDRLRNVLKTHPEAQYSSLVVSGGVASNLELRKRLRKCLDTSGGLHMSLLFPPVHLCTDNAVMIAWAAFERFNRQMFDDFDTPVRGKWNISDCAAMT